MTENNCSCPEFDRTARITQGRMTMSRRRLLGTAGALGGGMAATELIGDAFREVTYAATPGGNVVVVLSLRGGADGLSMVVPRGADHDVLRNNRPDTVVPEASLIGGTTGFGLHPAFAPLLPMWQAGKFGAVHAVGQPAPNRSHFASIEVIEDADPGTTERRGWLNRMVGVSGMSQGELGVSVGGQPLSMRGAADTVSLNTLGDLRLPELAHRDQWERAVALRTVWSGNSLLADTMRTTVNTAMRLDNLPDLTVNAAAYPDGPLQEVLANTAALIKADVGTRVVTVDYGNWDMHAGLGKHDNGWMNRQVTHLAKSLRAFFDDLGAVGDRVTVVTMSEFGRRVKQNASGGVDHGYGNAMLVLGGGVKGGGVRGLWPGLASLTDGDLSVKQDFRSVLWEVISKRFPDLTGSKATLFPGFNPEAIGIMA